MDRSSKTAMLKDQFRKIDKNGDNRLDFNEFLALMPGLTMKAAHKLFEQVDKSDDGTIDFGEFVDYIYSPAGSRTTAGRHMRLAATNAVDTGSENESMWDVCLAVFETYMGSDKKFEGKDLKKLCVDCKLFDRKFTKNDVDIIFAKFKPRGKNMIDFEAFKNCCRAIADRKGTATQAVQAAVAERNALGVETNATEAAFVRFHDDKSTYTGVHTANEFHASGGAASQGRDSRHERIKNESAYDHEGGEELPWDQVLSSFRAFCQGGSSMEGKDFVRMCVDCELFMRRKFEQADADIIFNKVKTRGERRIDFQQFQDACVGIARKRDCPVSEVQSLIRSSGGPMQHGVTEADEVRFHDDPSTYTGIHAAGQFIDY